MTGRPFPPRVAALIDVRDEGRCQRCGGTTARLHQHHRRLKGSGRTGPAHTQCCCNAVSLCFRCHDWAHVQGRAVAERLGFVVSRSEPEPGWVAVARFGGSTRWYATCNGKWAGAGGKADPWNR